METIKSSVRKIDRDVGLTLSFVALAYLGGRKRFVEMLPATNQRGLFFAAGASTAGLGVARLAEGRVYYRRKKSLLYYLRKSTIVAGAALYTTPWAITRFGKGSAKISSKCRHQFAAGTTGLIIGSRFVSPLTRRATRRQVNRGPRPETPDVRVVDPENLRADLERIERRPIRDWTLKENVRLFDIDTFLEPLGDEDVLDNGEYIEVFDFVERESGDPSFAECRNVINTKYGNYLYGEAGTVKWYLNKIFSHLLDKMETIQDGEKEAFSDLVDRVVRGIVDSRNECPYQALSQIQALAIATVDDQEELSVEKRVAMEVMQYRMGLIKKVVQKSGLNNVHYEIAIGLVIHKELGLPVPRSLRAGERHYASRKEIDAFKKQYDPIKYLAENVSYHTARKLFAQMGLWYAKRLFPEGLSGAKEQERAELLGADFITFPRNKIILQPMTWNRAA